MSISHHSSVTFVVALQICCVPDGARVLLFTILNDRAFDQWHHPFETQDTLRHILS